MYLDHYHLKAKPFDLSPGPRFLWLGEKHKEALATLTYGISEDLGFLLLTGDVGVGKTALIHRLIKNLDSSTIVAHITDPGLGTIDFFKLLAAEFNIPTEFYSKAPFLIELEKFLYAAYSDQKKVLLIVDEAQRLNNKLLDQIRVLSNIELTDRKLINIFFVGQPEFKKMLMANSNRAIRQRIAINYHINALTESETGQYIEHRLKVAGATQRIFKSNAIREIFRFSGGYPRAINVICDHALLTGFASGLKSIDSDVIKECEQELNIRAGFDFSRTAFQTSTDTSQPETRQTPPRRSMSMGVPILIGLVIVLGSLVSYYLLWPAPRWTTTPDTQNKLADASRDEVAPDEKVTVADGQPPLFTAQASPAPDPLPYISEEDSRVPVPAKAAPDATVVADLAAAKPEPKANLTPWEKIVAQQDATPAREIDTDPVGQAAVTAAEAPPEPTPSTETPAVDSPVTAAGKAAAAAAVLAAGPESKSDPSSINETVAQDAPPVREVETEADRQTAVSEAVASPEPAPPPDTPVIESEATAPGKTGATATAVAILAAKPEPTVDPSPRNETVAQDAQSARKADTVANGQAADSVAKAEPELAPSRDEPVVESDATTPGKVEAGAAALAVLAAPEPSPSVNPGTSVGNAIEKPATNALKPIDTQGSPANESGSPATALPSTTTAGETTSVEEAPSGNRPEESLSAKAETQLKSSSEVSVSTAASSEQLDVIDMENRLRSFLQTYCNTYAAKDLNRFTSFFTANAMENGKSFESLVPKYERNFQFIETIQYRIELQDFSIVKDQQIIIIDGDFFLKWLPPDKQWRENSGKISMSLIENGATFLVQRIDYQGGSSKKN